MIKRYSNEFSKLYKRLMRLELQIKASAFSAIIQIYQKDALNQLKNFFTNTPRSKKYESVKGNVLNIILSNKNLTNDEKLKQLLQSLYLSDLLTLILTYKQFTRNEIAEIFYFKVPENYMKLKKQRFLLKNLRNDIAHYNFSNYEKNKKEYWDALLEFEVYFGFSPKGIFELPFFGYKPNLKEILYKIGEARPDLLQVSYEESEYFYNKDRVLLDLYDEIALYNGYDETDLQSPWSILREVYRVKNEVLKNKISITS